MGDSSEHRNMDDDDHKYSYHPQPKQSYKGNARAHHLKVDTENMVRVTDGQKIIKEARQI